MIKMDIRNKTYGDVLVLSPEGRIDHANSEEFRRALDPLIQRSSVNGERLLDFVPDVGGSQRDRDRAARPPQAYPHGH